MSARRSRPSVPADLFSAAGIPFNLASAEQREPQAPTPTAAATVEMFGAAEVRSYAPTKLDKANETARLRAGGAA